MTSKFNRCVFMRWIGCSTLPLDTNPCELSHMADLRLVFGNVMSTDGSRVTTTSERSDSKIINQAPPILCDASCLRSMRK